MHACHSQCRRSTIATAIRPAIAIIPAVGSSFPLPLPLWRYRGPTAGPTAATGCSALRQQSRSIISVLRPYANAIFAANGVRALLSYASGSGPSAGSSPGLGPVFDLGQWAAATQHWAQALATGAEKRKVAKNQLFRGTRA